MASQASRGAMLQRARAAPRLLTSTAGVPGIARQTLITLGPRGSRLTLTESRAITALMDGAQGVTITLCRNETTHRLEGRPRARRVPTPTRCGHQRLASSRRDAATEPSGKGGRGRSIYLPGLPGYRLYDTGGNQLKPSREIRHRAPHHQWGPVERPFVGPLTPSHERRQPCGR